MLTSSPATAAAAASASVERLRTPIVEQAEVCALCGSTDRVLLEQLPPAARVHLGVAPAARGGSVPFCAGCARRQRACTGVGWWLACVIPAPFVAVALGVSTRGATSGWTALAAALVGAFMGNMIALRVVERLRQRRRPWSVRAVDGGHLEIERSATAAGLAPYVSATLSTLFTLLGLLLVWVDVHPRLVIDNPLPAPCSVAVGSDVVAVDARSMREVRVLDDARSFVITCAGVATTRKVETGRWWLLSTTDPVIAR